MGSASTFISSCFFFFFFFFAFVDFGRQFLLLWTVYTLFTHCAYTIHVLKNIKNGSRDTIYTFIYYFTTVFSVFSFQFSATISSIQTHPRCGIKYIWCLCFGRIFILVDEKKSWDHFCNTRKKKKKKKEGYLSKLIYGVNFYN